MRKSSIPNIFTFINLSCGVLGLLSIFHENYITSCVLIILAAIVDRYDGRVARFLNVTSDLGKELDSLADLVSFGVAPALLIYTFFDLGSVGPKGVIGIILLILFPICGAFRLARYNVADFDGVFTGVPITVTGCFLAVFALISAYSVKITYLAIIFMLLGSYLMVSTFKLKKI